MFYLYSHRNSTVLLTTQPPSPPSPWSCCTLCFIEVGRSTGGGLSVSMAMAKFVAVLILALITISFLQTMAMASHGHGGHHYNNGGKYGPGSLKSSQCPSQCSRRCGRTQYHKPCMFFCQKCCAKCLCVPPGYYGNKAVCPCYNNWKTKEGGPKCP